MRTILYMPISKGAQKLKEELEEAEVNFIVILSDDRIEPTLLVEDEAFSRRGYVAIRQYIKYIKGQKRSK